MNYAKAIFLGLVQGLTEFLPVSSSGHLVLFQRILGIKGDMLLFDIVLHLGTLLAVLIVFRKDLWECIKRPFGKTTLSLIIATIPAISIALFFGGFIEKTFSGGYLGFGFLITAGLLFAGQKAANYKLQITNYKLGFKGAVIIGLFQGAALLPGISRSGATVCGGLLSGAEKDSAARFSFLMSVPVILGAAARELFKLRTVTQSAGALPLFLGFLFAALAGFVSIKFMLGIIKKARFWLFSIYLFLLGGFVLLNQYVFLWF